MKQWRKIMLSLAAAAVLSACGGGNGGDDAAGDDGAGDPPAAGAADKYVGTWLMSCNSYGTTTESETETITVTKTSDTQLEVAFVLSAYPNATCSGPATVENFQGTVTIDGQTTASYQGQPEAFDQLTATVATEGTFRWLGTVRSNGQQMVIDFEDNDIDSSTVYPTDPNEGQSVYTKQ